MTFFLSSERGVPKRGGGVQHFGKNSQKIQFFWGATPLPFNPSHYILSQASTDLAVLGCLKTNRTTWKTFGLTLMDGANLLRLQLQYTFWQRIKSMMATKCRKRYVVVENRAKLKSSSTTPGCTSSSLIYFCLKCKCSSNMSHMILQYAFFTLFILG